MNNNIENKLPTWGDLLNLLQVIDKELLTQPIRVIGPNTTCTVTVLRTYNEDYYDNEDGPIRTKEDVIDDCYIDQVESGEKTEEEFEEWVEKEFDKEYKPMFLKGEPDLYSLDS